MKATLLKLHNIMCFDDVEFHLGGFNVFRGPNGSGKTTVKEAIRSIVDGGHDATLIKDGADEGEIVLIFDDESIVRKTIRPTDSSLTAIDGKGVRQTKAQAWVNSLLDRVATNPVAFLTADPKKRVSILLASIPLELTDDQRKELLAAGATRLEVDAERHPLEKLNAIRARIFDERTGVNRIVKEKSASADQLRQSLPLNVGEVDYSAQMAEIDSKIDALQKERTDTVSVIERERSEAVSNAEAQYSGLVADLKIQCQAEIDAIKAKYQKQVDAARDDRDTLVKSAESHASDTKAMYTQQIDADISAHRESLATLRAKHDEDQRARLVLAEAEKFEDAIQKGERRSEELTQSLKAIDRVRLQLLKALPAGLEVKDGQIYRGGIVYDRLNTAQQIELAIEIVKMNGGLMLLDNAESLDQDSFAELERQVIGSDVQAIVTEVTRDASITELQHVTKTSLVEA
jgi:energy-coupling factor transporter ATP-binding protein EcfA2